MLNQQNALLLIIDMQQAFDSAVHEFGKIVERARIMIESAKLLDIPIIVSEQFPQGLQRTVDVLQKALGDIHYYEKTEFSCLRNEEIFQAVKDSGRSQVLLAGVESHVCVSQTAYDLQATGLEPIILADVVSSRRPFDKQIALGRFRADSMEITTTEAAIFEILRDSKHPCFKEISKLIR
ncbi:MAG: isochorismatase family protein [Phycisphaerae bacterium]|nr:isochorismatase family protein [Phycisphaerae bacterium]